MTRNQAFADTIFILRECDWDIYRAMRLLRRYGGCLCDACRMGYMAKIERLLSETVTTYENELVAEAATMSVSLALQRAARRIGYLNCGV